VEVARSHPKLRKWIRFGGVGLAVALLLTPYPLQAEKASIRLYQRWASPYVGRVVHCRYQPTCSNYALLALDESGFWVGNLRIVARLAMCSPLGALVDAVRN